MVVVGRRRARHHVERGLGHVGVRMPSRLGFAVELAFDGRDIDNMFVAFTGAEHQWFEPRVEDEGRRGINQMDFQQLDGGDFGEGKPP